MEKAGSLSGMSHDHISILLIHGGVSVLVDTLIEADNVEWEVFFYVFAAFTLASMNER